MANTIPYSTFNWKATDQIRAWDIFQAKAELWLAGEEIKDEIQYTKIVLMLGDEGLSRWSKFNMGAEEKENPKICLCKIQRKSWTRYFLLNCKSNTLQQLQTTERRNSSRIGSQTLQIGRGMQIPNSS